MADLPALKSAATYGSTVFQAAASVRGAIAPAGGNAKIEKAAKDFESILLGNWLQSAENSFATLPGGDEDEDASAGHEQLQSIATQSLGVAMSAAGGIGIAKMIAHQLHRAAAAESGPE